ncbi:MAG: hypothetical protein HY420_03045 [Candidatus Kerfeldbacteria bacterium]|nr:hypothetical protein [Candidatus Kerfeldbacteria bacterium]
MFIPDRRGLGLISTLLILTVVAAFLAGVGLLLSQERARVRDARRIADMVRVQFAFETLFREKASYSEAASGCGQVEVLVSTCALTTYLPQVQNLKDPGRYAYRVAKVPDERDYAISFVLERAYESLAKGKHVLSKDGVR